MDLLVQIALIILYVLCVTFVSMLIHEAGHAIAGHLSGFTILAVGAGTRRPFLLHRNPGGTIFYLCRENPLQGITWALHPDLFPPASAHAWLLFGGPLANLIVAILAAIGLWVFHAPSSLLFPIFWLNTLFGVLNLIPFSAAVSGVPLRSDGSQLVVLLRKAGGHRPFFAPSTLLSLRPLWEEIGDNRHLRIQLMNAAASMLILEDVVEARRYLAEAEALPPLDSMPGFAGQERVIRGLLLVEEGAKEAGRAEGQRAVEEFAALGLEPARLWAEVAGPAEESQERLAEIEVSPHTAAHPFLRLAVTSTRARLAAQTDASDREALLAHYESSRRRMRYDPMDLAVYRKVAASRERQGDLGGAVLAYEQAVLAARRVFDALESAPETQSHYADRFQPLIEDAARCLELLDRGGEAERIRALLPNGAEATRQREHALATGTDRAGQQRRKDRTVLTVSLILLALTVVVSFTIVAISLSGPTIPAIMGQSFLVGGAIALIYSLCVLLVSLIRWVFTRKPFSSGGTGWNVLFAVGLGWVMMVYFYWRVSHHPPRPQPPISRRANS